ncbi:polysaccharide deacetylase family protein [Hyphomicrobium sp.]|uniref:polysaccharide deacetylase family protein n=1 Tax=Hyphomicrobium sp. TaxID=82 RepID=UPI002FDEBF71
MSASRCTWLALAFAAVAGAMLVSGNVRAETGFDVPHPHAPHGTHDGGGHDGGYALSVGPAVATVDRPDITSGCHARPDALGTSRVVEIDATGGLEFGEQYLKDEPKFLEPGEVVLTFDDGPSRRYTVPILNALDADCVKATFFSVGRMAISDPATLREVVRRGHTVGTHTWSHKNLASLGDAAMKREFELGLSAVAAAVGGPVAPFFRFPYLGHSKATRDYIKSRGFGIFGIHVDSKDFRTKSPGIVLRNVLAQLDRTKKGILLFHDIQPSTAGALASLLAELKARGYRVVHIESAHPAITLPEYDAIAEKALASKSAAAAKAPLADRAATWPISGPDEHGSAPHPAPSARASKPAAPASHPAKPHDWANPGNDPWQLRSFGWD